MCGVRRLERREADMVGLMGDIEKSSRGDESGIPVDEREDRERAS